MISRTPNGLKMVAAACLSVAGLLMAPAAEATPTLTFDQVNQGGTIEYSTVGGSLEGIDIIFEFFTAAGTSADGIYFCDTVCTLNFETGNVIGDPDGPVYTFAGGGTFTMTGGFAALGIPDGSTLLSGSWTTNPANIAVAVGSLISFSGFGIDEKSEALAAALGIDPTQWRFASSEFSLGQATVNPDGTFSGTITQADFQNIKVPEPGSSLLLLLGLGSLVAYRRRKN